MRHNPQAVRRGRQLEQAFFLLSSPTFAASPSVGAVRSESMAAERPTHSDVEFGPVCENPPKPHERRGGAGQGPPPGGRVEILTLPPRSGRHERHRLPHVISGCGSLTAFFVNHPRSGVEWIAAHCEFLRGLGEMAAAFATGIG